MSKQRCDFCGEADGTVKARNGAPVIDFGHGDLCDRCEKERAEKAYEERLVAAQAEDAVNFPDGMQYGETRGAAARVRYEETQRLNREAADACRYCKSARTRSGDAGAMCTEHRDRSRLNFACSPVSETYWCS